MTLDFSQPWRVGRSLERTIYQAVGDEASKDDILLGLVDTPSIADHIVALHNRWLEERDRLTITTAELKTEAIAEAVYEELLRLQRKGRGV